MSLAFYFLYIVQMVHCSTQPSIIRGMKN